MPALCSTYDHLCIGAELLLSYGGLVLATTIANPNPNPNPNPLPGAELRRPGTRHGPWRGAASAEGHHSRLAVAGVVDVTGVGRDS